MEKFAIDLDKVLDEFELNEDEQDNSSQYDKLQLEFSHEEVEQGIAATGNSWHMEKNDVLPFTTTKSIPNDGRNVSNNQSRPKEIEINSTSSINGSFNLVHSLCQVTSEISSSDSNTGHIKSYLNQSQNDITVSVPSKTENCNLWPNLDSKWELTRETAESASELSPTIEGGAASLEADSVSAEAVLNLPEAKNLQVMDTFSLPCSLDIIQVDDKHSSSALLGSHESQHPDILDLRKSDCRRDVNIDIALQGCSHLTEENILEASEDQNQSLLHNSPDIQREAKCLLPDLMHVSVDENNLSSEANSEVFRKDNPIDITQNLSLTKPAIVEESQAIGRVPELVNVHQTVETGFDICRMNPSTSFDHSNDLSLVNENLTSNPSEETNATSENEACALVLTNEDTSEEIPKDLVKFDPRSAVDVHELEAELEELEEQARLLGAYQSAPSKSEGTSMAEEETQVNPDMEINDTDAVNIESEPVFSMEEIKEEETENIANVSDDSPSVESNECSGQIVSTIEEDNEVILENNEGVPIETQMNVREPEVNGSDDALLDDQKSDAENVQEMQDDYPIENPEVFEDGSDSYESGSIGAVAPFWIPDEEAANCQECGVKFTVLKRRHHCRGCGRVLCSPCCHFKAPLPYMDYKEARVCSTCLQLLTQERTSSDGECSLRSPGRSPDPNNPMDYCSRIPPQQQVGSAAVGPPPTVMVPVGVLKRETSGTGGSGRPRSTKQVIFSDGIRPGGDLTESGRHGSSLQIREKGRNTRRVLQNLTGKSNGVESSSSGCVRLTKDKLVPRRSVSMDTCLIPVGLNQLPPLLCKSSNGEYAFDTNPDTAKLEEMMRSEDGEPVVFALRKNVSVLVKLVKLDCCVGLEVWNVATRGLCNVGQDEIVILLEVKPGEKCPPPHLFAFLNTVYQEANKGNLVVEMGHSIFTEPDGFFGSKDHGGFLYIRPSYQCLQKLILPPRPFLFAILIQKWETPWAKVFPLRLMLRLGAEFRYYPCPLVSTRHRKSVYCEIGQTIMNLLVDFRNYSYTIPIIQGLFIHMEDKRTTLLIPRSAYQQVTKALNNSNDHVLALCANFSPHADSHLVTVEDDDGRYTTQAINIHNKPRKITGASFIVFNGALKYNSGMKAKSSIVEDGLMVQILPEMMSSLRESLRNMKDLEIPCGLCSSGDPDEAVLVKWTADDQNFNIGVTSPIDGMQMDGIPSIKIHAGTDYMTNDFLIRWTEVFIIQGEAINSTNDINISRLAEGLARAFCMALTPHLGLLYDAWPTRLALRATIHQDNVGYEAGMGGTHLAPLCMKELDGELVPVIHRAAAGVTDRPVVLELVFHIME